MNHLEKPDVYRAPDMPSTECDFIQSEAYKNSNFQIDILKVSGGRRRIEECFLALLVYHILEKKLGGGYTCEEILRKLREMDFADIEDQGYMLLYRRTRLTDALHEACGFRTDYQFIIRQKMRNIQKRSKGRE